MPQANGSNGSHGDRKLVVVQQSGGNDYLNSVVPYTQRALLRLPRSHPPRPGRSPEDRRHGRIRPYYGSHQGTVGPGQGGCDQRGRLSEPGQVAFPIDGHLAYRRAGGTQPGGVAGPCDPGDGPEGRECAHRCQLRGWAAQGAGMRRRSGSVGRQPGNLWPVPGHGGPVAARVRPGGVRQDVRGRRREGSRDGLPGPDGHRRTQGRGHPEHRTRSSTPRPSSTAATGSPRA